MVKLNLASIKAYQVHVDYGIGVTTQKFGLSQCEGDKRDKRDVHMYSGHYGKIYLLSGNATETNNVPKWGTGDTITIELDISNGRITYYKNNVRVGSGYYGIERNQTYYPIVQSCGYWDEKENKKNHFEVVTPSY